MDLEELLIGREKGLMVDPHEGEVFGTLTIVGRVTYRADSGKSINECVVHCSVCCKDPELYGEGYFDELYYRLKQGIKPCGCGIRTRPTEAQYKILVQRHATKNGLVFIGWEGEYNNNYTKCRITCPIHGELSPKRVNQFINAEVKCRRCMAARLEICKPKPDAEMIAMFFESGSFSEETVFYRSDRKCGRGKKIYWFVECSDCGCVGESTSQDLKAGKRPCNCSIRMPKYSYLVLLKEYDVDIALKLGITSNYKRRLKDLDNSSKYPIETLGLWEYQSSVECRAAELECLRALDCGVIDRELFPNGYTETTSINNLEFIVNTYEQYGGIRLTVH